MHDIIKSYADSLAGSTPEEAQRLMREAEYVTKLLHHDWTFQYSDDHKVWQRGNEERMVLMSMQRQLDPTGEVWNRFAPDGYKLMPAAA